MALILLAAELALGGAILGLSGRTLGRTDDAGAIEAARLAGAAAPLAAVVAATALILGLAAGEHGPARALAGALQSPSFTARAVAGAIAVPGCFLMLAAGRAERCGRLVRSRRLVRRGGLMLAAGALGQVAADAAALIAPAGADPSWIAPASAALAGAAGLLAGLSGKPRPAGPIAAALVVAGALAITARV